MKYNLQRNIDDKVLQWQCSDKNGSSAVYFYLPIHKKELLVPL